MIDCGEGTQRQLLKSGLGFKKLDKILLTHGHLDHILGLAGLMSTLMRWEAINELNIYGGRPALERVQDLINKIVLRDAEAPITVNYNELQPGVIFADDSFELSAFPVTHRGTGNFGFLFREKSHRPFLNERAEALGVPFGPERKRLVAGESIALADGRMIHPADVLDAEVPGAALAIIGDAGRTDNLIDYVRDVDALVIESTYLDVESDLAQAYGHLTATQGARLAQTAHVRKLILTHVSRRYTEKEVLSEARSIFPEAVVARDLDRYRIQKDKSALVTDAPVQEESDVTA
jgi:ribonuclease Z